MGIEFCQSWLAIVIEDQDGVDHCDSASLPIYLCGVVDFGADDLLGCMSLAVILVG